MTNKFKMQKISYNKIVLALFRSNFQCQCNFRQIIFLQKSNFRIEGFITINYYTNNMGLKTNFSVKANDAPQTLIRFNYVMEEMC